jgi:hypothetical protein
MFIGGGVSYCLLLLLKYTFQLTWPLTEIVLFIIVLPLMKLGAFTSRDGEGKIG